MTFQIQAALLAIVLSVGLICLFLRFAPAQASLSDVLDNLGAHRSNEAPDEAFDDDSIRGKVGTRLLPYTTDSTILRIPRSDLAILKIGIPYFLGDKVLSALVGLLFFPALNLMLTALGHGLPWGIPTILSIAVAGVLFITPPDIDVRKKAAAAREEFSRSLGAYIEFVALNRTGASVLCRASNVQLPLEIPGSSDGSTKSSCGLNVLVRLRGIPSPAFPVNSNCPTSPTLRTS